MDDLKSLFDKKEYDLVLKLTDQTNEPSEMFMHLLSLVMLKKDNDAIDYINQNNDIFFKKYPVKITKLHFELLLKNKLFDEAKIALDKYENKPYVSQEYEELLRFEKDEIQDAMMPDEKKNVFTIDEICETLENEKDNGKLSQVLFVLKDYNFDSYFDSLKTVLTRKEIHPNLRTYALIVMVDHKVDEAISFLSNEGLKVVNPSKLLPPFMSDKFNALISLIQEKADTNVTVTQTAIQLLNCYIMDTYPNNIFADTENDLADAFIIIAKDYLKIAHSDSSDLADKIRKIIESTPKLVF